MSDNTFLMRSNDGIHVKFLPLYLHRFRLIAPRKIIEAQSFNKQYHRYEEIDNIPDRLRWCRHSQGLLQNEVADYLEMHRCTYSNIEAGYSHSYTYEMARKLSDLYGLPERDFMDEFSQFLYDGQAQRIRAYRARLGMGRKPFCRYTGIPLTNIRIWESDQKVISRKSWEKYFKGRA